MATRDYYEILGVERTIDAPGLKAAYRKLAMLHHPDRNGGSEESMAMFKEGPKKIAGASIARRQTMARTVWKLYLSKKVQFGQTASLQRSNAAAGVPKRAFLGHTSHHHVSPLCPHC